MPKALGFARVDGVRCPTLRATGRALALGILTSLLGAPAARAADPLNTNNAVGRQVSPGPPQTVINVVPVAGGNTDIGVGAGYFAGLSRMQKGREPFVWDVQSAGFLSLKPGDIPIPYADVYARVTIPRLFGRAMRVELRPSFTTEATLGYFGIGNRASPGATPGEYYQFGRTHPRLDALVRVRVVDHVHFVTGMGYTHNWLDVRSPSKLASDLESGDPEVKALLGGTAPHGVVLFSYGLALDTRNSEVSPSRGTFDELTIRLSPGQSELLPYRYAQATMNLRGYVPLGWRDLVLAGRLVGDVLVGSPPFYELARFENTYAIGGVNGVRGVLAQRYQGKVKVFGNAELRAKLGAFRAFGKDLRIGGAAFFDVGRVFADTSPRPTLDGRGWDLHFGVGGGLRLFSGETFVLRFDGAWSPKADPIGLYVAAGELF